MLEKNLGNWNKKHKLFKSERRRNPLAPTHTPLPIRLETPPKNSSLEEKALKVIEDRSFIIPNNLTNTWSGMRMDEKKAGEYILSKWPLKEASKVLDMIDEVEVFCFQGVSTRSVKQESEFVTPFVHTGSSELKKSTIPNFSFTNIFWEKEIGEAELKTAYGHSPEATQQNDYENKPLNNVYKLEIERLLKLQHKMGDGYHLGDYPNATFIVSLLKEGIVVALDYIGEHATSRNKREPIIFHSKKTKTLVDFLVKHQSLGLNAIFSLLFSTELMPDASFPRSEGFYANENKRSLIVTDGQLKEFELKRFGKTSLGKVRRLRPIED